MMTMEWICLKRRRRVDGPTAHIYAAEHVNRRSSGTLPDEATSAPQQAPLRNSVGERPDAVNRRSIR
jgi:hypothetical protein